MINHAHSDASSRACPVCGEHELIQIRRRAVDRFLSIFVVRQRFRCTEFHCHWQGNLTDRSTLARPSKSIHLPLLIVGIVAMLFGIVAMTMMPIMG
jgi:transposase-like protein